MRNGEKKGGKVKEQKYKQNICLVLADENLSKCQGNPEKESKITLSEEELDGLC